MYYWNNYFSAIPIESIIRDKQQEYYKVLELCGSTGESTLFIEFSLKAILEAIHKVGNLTDNQQKILEQIKINKKISASKLWYIDQNLKSKASLKELVELVEIGK